MYYLKNFASKLFSTVMLLCFAHSPAFGQLPARIDEGLWANVKALSGIPTQSDATSASLYIFFDPNCPVCARLWQARMAHTDVKNVSAIWIPVSYMSSSSFSKASSLLRSRSKASLEKNFSEFNFTQREGGIDAVTATAEERLLLGKSRAVWERLGGGTPLMVWRMRSTGAPVTYIGMPPIERLTELLKDVVPARLETYKKN
jgi:thiol:disulfide interchange protein DsbG